jgi:hypothetical protein
MTTPAQKTTRARAAHAPKPTPTQAPAAAGKPYLRFYHSAKLRARTCAVLAAVESADDPTAHCDELADVIQELVESGLDYYFLGSLKAANAGFIVQQSATLGLMGVRTGMGAVIRNILKRMDGPQLLSLCGSIRGFMV